ncbi:MAG: aldehyde dehydrogenase family protein [Proteobacteria bacterium]|nr:aldehyde dehydrogenase family protein [Pseudomonadota bacterium]
MLPSETPEHPFDGSKLQAVRNQLLAGFRAGRLRNRMERISALNALERLVQENQELLCQAVLEDLGRPKEDSMLAELTVVIEEIHAARKNLARWMKPRHKLMPLPLFPSRGEVTPQPYGIALIIGPWNYPLQLMLVPLAAALAAGNCALLKPSEMAPACSRILGALLQKYLPSDIVSVVEGDAEVSRQLLELKWDIIFFTGSTQIGRVVAQAAAKHLTPAVLELGGKSPCIVDSTADLEVTARRIIWGKLLNSGQTCVAPDYIFTPRGNVENLCRQLEITIKEFFPQGFVLGESYCGIVNQRHFERLEKIAAAHKNQLRIGGRLNQSQRIIEPSFYILDSKSLGSAAIMQDEIFGPLMPIVPYESVDEAIGYINANDHPLALYVFSSDSSLISKVESSTRSGSFVVNDTVIQLAASQLPFGGVGASGTGAYHGEAGFNVFSHFRSVLKRPFWLDLPIRYRPYSALKIWILKKMFGLRTAKLKS